MGNSEGAGVIAIARRHVEAGTADADFDGVIIAGLVLVARREGKRVLVARFFGDLGVKAVEIFFPSGVESVAARLDGVAVGLAEAVLKNGFARDGMGNRDRINGNVGFEEETQSFVESVLIVAGIAAVGNEENNFATVAAPALQHLTGGEDGIIERVVVRGACGTVERNALAGRKRLAVDDGAGGGGIGVDRRRMGGDFKAFELSEQGIVVGGKIRNLIGIGRVLHQGHFISRAESGGNGDEAFLNFLCLFIGEVVVDEDDGRERKGIRVEEDDLLFGAILEDFEIVALQAGNELPASVFDGDWDEDKIRAGNDSGADALLRKGAAGPLLRGHTRGSMLGIRGLRAGGSARDQRGR